MTKQMSQMGLISLMKNHQLLIIFLFVLSASSFANTVDCYDKLTKGMQDSAHFSQHSSEVYSNSSESLDEQMALNAVNLTMSELGCKQHFNLEQVKCVEALNTTMCRLDFLYGYFLIVKDYVDTVNLLFNRWD